MSNVLAGERMDREENLEGKACKRLREARMTVEEKASISEIFMVFKDAVIPLAAKMVRYKLMTSQRKGSAWWTVEVKEDIKGKRGANKKMLQRNMAEKIRVKE